MSRSEFQDRGNDGTETEDTSVLDAGLADKVEQGLTASLAPAKWDLAKSDFPALKFPPTTPGDWPRPLQEEDVSHLLQMGFNPYDSELEFLRIADIKPFYEDPLSLTLPC